MTDKLTAEYGKELFRYLDAAGRLRSVRESGVTLVQTWDDRTWRVKFRMKADADPLVWREQKRQQYLERPDWARDVKQLPAQAELEEWMRDAGCDTVTGHWVEEDGVGPDGAPSWLRALCLI